MLFRKPYLLLAFHIALNCLALDAVAQEQSPKPEPLVRIDVQQITTLLAAIGRDIPQIQPQLAAATRKDAVIFIPGILGSRLKHAGSGNVIWGEGLPSVKALALDESGPPAEADILEEYVADFYGDMLRTLEGILGAKELVLKFAYDWRHDIDRVAGWLDESIQTVPWREQLKHKRVIIIAHSMGGLVAWRWKDLYYVNQKSRYPFELAWVVVLGAPLQGSCEVMSMLLSGYGLPSGANELLNYGFKTLLKGAHAAAYTFPSVFQLLPAFDPADPDKSCLVADLPALKGGGRDHFSLPIWQTVLVPRIDQRTCGLVWKCAVWDDLGMSQDRFVDLLARMLERATKFRKSFALGESARDDRVRYFYSDMHPTVTQVTVGESSIEPKVEKKGDGRVVKDSATNTGYRGVASDAIRLDAGHVKLPKDERFMAWLQDKLRASIMQERAMDALQIVSEENHARQKFIESRSVVALTDLGVDPLGEPEDQRARTIIKLNAEAFRHIIGVPESQLSAPDLAREAYRFAESTRKTPQARLAIPLYEVALVNAKLSSGERYTLVTSYSAALLEERLYRMAIRVLDPRIDELTRDPRVKPYALYNLGLAYHGLGDLGKARLHYKSAKAAAPSGSDIEQAVSAVLLRLGGE